MSVENNVALMKRWFQEVWNEGRVQTIHELLAKDFVGLGQDAPGVAIHGPEGFVDLHQRFRDAFSEFKFTVDDIFGAGDKVMVRWSAEMSHTGDHLGIRATHKKVRITGITIARIDGGKVVEGWDNWDQLALMQQLSAQAEGSARTSR
jgi:steroid delta-isomerase-like uncharacterized protein